ncbi:importin-11-like [Mytilus galloprovincialis]|uniref:importin-11-like n=1 Tax=Mytilus galloprovincialis TaxID=29158 RepID=UPI003F7C9506
MTNPSIAVLEALHNACSQNADILKPAEKQLQDWEIHPGFYSVLSEIFSNHSIDVNVRWLAVLYCKNGVEKYWRKTAPNAMKEEEKELLKERLISNFNEPVHQISLQLAVLIAKIARVDCPRNWSRLLPVLFEAVRCHDEHTQEQALLVLHHVTKTLASKRLPGDRKLFEELTNDVFSFILGLWTTTLDQFGQLALKQSDNSNNSLDKSILALRILRKQTAFGFKEPGENADVNIFLKQIFTRFKQMLDCRQSMWGNHQVIEKCEKIIILMTKVLLDLVDMHPVTFIPLIRPSLELTVAYNFSESEKGLLFEKFTVNCFNLMKSIVLCDMYKPLRNSSELTEPMRQESCKIKTEFFTFATLSEICRRLVSQYFLLSSEDLNTWDTDPEEFCQEEIGDSYRYSIKPCTEALFLALFKENRMSLSPVLIEMVHQIQLTSDPNDIMAVLRKDAVYNAVGLSAFDLFDDINFDEWFTSHLLSELTNRHVNYRIIRRRVIWLIGQWVGVKMSQSLRPNLYQALIPLLAKEEDLVVRLEAAQTLKTAVDDFEFSVDQFLPFLETLFSLLFQLLQEVRECDTKMQVLHVISFVIERVGPKIQQYATALIHYLPALWQESAEHNMLRCAILTTLIHLVQGFGTSCSCMFNFLLPVIQMSTDVTQDQYIYLVEDGVELWHVTLQNTSASTDHMLQLFSNMTGLLELGTENLRMCLKVIEDYILLCPVEFMQQYSSVLVQSLGSLMTDIKTEAQVLVLRVIELVLKTFPKEAPEAFSPLLPSFIKAVLENEEHPLILSMYLTLLARIVLQNQEFMFNFLNQVATDLNKDSESVLGMFLDILSEKIDSITQPEKRKLCALCVTSLLSLNLNVIKEKFCAIMCLCVEVLHDVTRIPVDEDPTIQLDSLVIHDDGADEDNEYYCGNEATDQITEHDRRKTKLSKKDPVHTIALREYLLSQLRACQLLHGQSVFNEMMDSVDSEIVHQLQEFTHKK